MDKEKIIKIAIAGVIGICAIVYYCFSQNQETNYDNILASDTVVENKIEEDTEESTTIKVYITGEVNAPGVVELEEGARIQDVIDSAGGIKAEANLKEVNLAYEVSDGEKIYIPNLSEENTEEAETSSTESSSSASSNSSNKKININKATAEELTTIPGIGASTAEKIITYRDENGKFKAVEDIKNVSGIGDAKYQKMEDYISVK